VTLVGVLAMTCIAVAIAWPLRGTDLWPLALPLALALGESGFVQTWNLSIDLPGVPVPIGWTDIVFASLVMAWLLVRRISPVGKPAPRLVHADLIPLAAWLALVAIAVPLAWIDGGAVKIGIAWTVFSYSYVPLCFVLMWDVLRRTSRAAMWRMLRTLSAVVTVLGAVYILHMLGLSLYDAAGVNSTYYFADGIRRDILTFPVWACVTAPFLLWSERIRLMEGAMLVVQAVAVAVSMTRSLVLSLALAALMVVVARVVYRRRPLQPLVPAGVALAGLGGLAVVMPGAISRVLDPLASRFDELSAGVGSVSTIGQRLAVGQRVSSFLSGWSLWMGEGFSDSAVAKSQNNLAQLLIADSLWSVVLLHFGIIGAAVVGATLAVGLGAGVVATHLRRAEPFSMAIVGTAALAWLAARTVASSEIIVNYPIVLAFVLALVTIEARDAWSDVAGARPMLFERGDAPVMPQWMRTSVLVKLVALAVVIAVEIVLGRMMGK
jgi:hypothetical protein